MSAPKAQHNDEDAGRLFTSRPRLTDISVMRRSSFVGIVRGAFAVIRLRSCP
jgi:hypothetical protein